MNKLLKLDYEEKWYKVWFTIILYDGSEAKVFEYGYGETQVKKLINKLNAYKVTEWR